MFTNYTSHYNHTMSQNFGIMIKHMDKDMIIYRQIFSRPCQIIIPKISRSNCWSNFANIMISIFLSKCSHMQVATTCYESTTIFCFLKRIAWQRKNSCGINMQYMLTQRTKCHATTNLFIAYVVNSLASLGNNAIQLSCKPSSEGTL